jgi:hypothetical protein
MPLGNAHHGAEGEPFDLARRIDGELRTRIEDAVDDACLSAMVKSREARGELPPAADNERDRQEYMARVAAFLELLRVEITATLDEEQRQRLGRAVLRPRADGVDAAIAVQVSLAKMLPDYWQRFEAVRLGPGADIDVSRREPRTLRDRLLGRG